MKSRTSATPHGGTGKFGKLLRKLRKTADVSITDLAKKAGIDPTVLSRIETGSRLPPELHTIIRITRELGIRQSSEQFEELWTLAEQERHPDGDAAEHIATMKELTVVALRQVLSDLETPATPDDVPVLPAFVEDVAGLVGRAAEEAVRRGATSITVRFADGTTRRWQVLPTAKAEEAEE